MVTIRKSSKLGRYYGWLMENFSSQGARWENLSLCYFVQNLFWRSLLALGIGAILSLVVVSIAMMALYPLALWLIPSLYEPLATVVSFLTWVALIIMVYASFGERLVLSIEKRFPFLAPKDKIEKEPSIIMEYLGSVKKKVCPIIHVTD